MTEEILKKSRRRPETASTTSSISSLPRYNYDDLEVQRGSLGRGAYGEVFKVKHPYFEESLALKVFYGGAASEDFEKELRSLVDLRHPSIVQVFGTIDSPSFGILLEYCPFTVSQAIHNNVNPDACDLMPPPPMDLPLFMKWTRQITGGMNYLHVTKNLIHRDLKPSNLLLTELHNIKIADFGVSRIVETMRTQEMTITGTCDYMSPEMCQGEYSFKADVFAFGVILWEMATGKRPYREVGGGGFGVVFKICHGARPGGSFNSAQEFSWDADKLLPSWMPTEIINMIVDCWDPNPDKRPSFEDISRILNEVQDRYGISKSLTSPLIMPKTPYLGGGPPHLMGSSAGATPNSQPSALPGGGGGSSARSGGGGMAMSNMGMGNSSVQTPPQFSSSKPRSKKELSLKFKNLSVFCDWEGDVRKIKLKKRPNFETLFEAITDKYNVDDVCIKYKDVSGRLVTVVDDDDVKDAIWNACGDRLEFFLEDEKGDDSSSSSEEEENTSSEDEEESSSQENTGSENESESDKEEEEEGGEGSENENGSEKGSDNEQEGGDGEAESGQSDNENQSEKESSSSSEEQEGSDEEEGEESSNQDEEEEESNSSSGEEGVCEYDSDSFESEGSDQETDLIGQKMSNLNLQNENEDTIQRPRTPPIGGKKRDPAGAAASASQLVKKSMPSLPTQISGVTMWERELERAKKISKTIDDDATVTFDRD